jgi:hypothetical protein
MFSPRNEPEPHMDGQMFRHTSNLLSNIRMKIRNFIFSKKDFLGIFSAK